MVPDSRSQGSNSMGTEPQNEITLARLDEEIIWYGKRKRRNRNLYAGIKALQITAAAFVPVLTSTEYGRTSLSWLIATLGAMVVVAEGFQQLGQFHQNWLRYGQACEALKREKYLFLAHAGDYSDSAVPVQLLAERLEDLLSQERGLWITEQRSSVRPSSQGQS